MRPSALITIGAALAALSCSRTPTTPATPVPAPPTSGTAAPAATAATPGEGTVRVPFTTATVTQATGGRQSGPRARMEPRVFPPRALLMDSTFSVDVMVGADGKAKLETLKLHAGATPEQLDAARRWLGEATFVPPLRDGAPVEAPFQVMGRAGVRALVGRSSSSASDAGTRVDTARALEMMEQMRGELSGRSLLQLAPRVARLRSDLDTLRLRPGERVYFASTLRIAAFDSADVFLGHLPRFSSRIRVGLMDIDGQSITASAEGVEQLHLTWPEQLWAGRTDAPVSVMVPVKSSRATTDAELMRQRRWTGWGTEQCDIDVPSVSCHAAAASVQSMDGREGASTLKYAVLHRTAPGTFGARPPRDPEAAAAQRRALRDAMRESEDRGRTFAGTVNGDGRRIGFEMASFGDSIWVGDRTFSAHWHRDSAMVILIDDREPTETVVRSLVIPARMPDGVTSKSWQSGDTLFHVRPRDTSAKWLAFFDRFPTIAEFLKP